MKIIFKIVALTFLVTSDLLALVGGQKLSGAKAPDWALGNWSCSATLISPRVILTAAHCRPDENNTIAYYHRRTGEPLRGIQYNHDQYIGSRLNDVAVIILDDKTNGLETIKIPSYDLENEMLTDNNLSFPYVENNNTGIAFYGNIHHDESYNFRTDAGYTAYYSKYDNTLEKYFPSSYRYTYQSLDRMLRETYPNILNIQEVFNNNFKNLLFNDLNMTINDVDQNILIVSRLPIIHQLPAKDWVRSAVGDGDSGGTVVYEKDGEEDPYLIGTISGTSNHPRLKHKWEWIINKVAEFSKEDAYHIASQVIGNKWGENDRKGEIGDLFVYNNPYNGDVEYFRLKRLGTDGRYWYFPTDKQDNYFWQYLGTQFPSVDEFELFNKCKRWGENDRKGNIGDLFVYVNPYNEDVEYFKLKRLGTDGRYWHFPTDKQDNYFWEYFGTGSPVTITATSAPVINTIFSDTALLENSGSTNYELNVSDVDGDWISLSVESNNTNILTVTQNWTNPIDQSIYASELDFNLTTVPDAFGVVKITITAENGGGSDTTSFEVNVAKPINLAKTGQTTSYADYDDANYSKGEDPSYTRDADGIVTDNLTALMWQDDTTSAQTPWADAQTYCAGLQLGGYTDWRVPNVRELNTLGDFGRSNPAIHPIFQNNQSSRYWTSTAYFDNTNNAFYVAFNDAKYGHEAKTNNYYVRCVRGDALPSSVLIRDDATDIVSDISTGLMWQDDAIGDKVTWTDAIQRCEGLTLGDYDDWRLPNIVELSSIVDWRTNNPAIDTTAFTNTYPRHYYWSSTSPTYNILTALSVYFYSGTQLHGNYKTSSYYARCVRGGE